MCFAIGLREFQRLQRMDRLRELGEGARVGMMARNDCEASQFAG